LSFLRNKRALLSMVRTTPEVAAAIAEGRPVVALESTIISHGMPYPRNLEMARAVEDVIRKHGATPATVAIIDGIPKAGLNESDLLKLANNSSGSVLKASTRDIAHACATGAMAATTVASTMRLAHLAGISVFATGGIGGVHREAETTMDVSADLLELSRTPVTVVCAGIKSILDIPKSLEVLETNSVPVLSYGTSVFPAFYTNDSGISSPRSVNTTSEVANIMHYQRLLRLDSGVLVAVPNPSPAHGDKIQYAINFALAGAKNEGIAGAKVTPYVLDKVQQLTGGESLESNIALVLNNARIAAGIAVDYAKLAESQAAVAGAKDVSAVKVYMPGNVVNGTAFTTATTTASAATVSEVVVATPSASSTPSVPLVSGTVQPQNASDGEYGDSLPVHPSSATTGAAHAEATAQHDRLHNKGNPDIMVVGGAVVDLIGYVTSLTKYRTSNPGQLNVSHGGVGRNIAESLARLGRNVSLATTVADDVNGRSILDGGSATGIDMSFVRILPPNAPTTETNHSDTSTAATTATTATTVHRTAMYNAIHDNSGDLCIGVADMSIFTQISPEYIHSLTCAIASARIVVADGNLSKEAFAALADVCAQQGVPLFFEPTSDHKCLLPFHAGRIQKVDILKPNVSELVQMVSHCLSAGMINSGRALVQNTLSTITSDRIDQDSMQRLDISDVRVLVNALYQVMHSLPGVNSTSHPAPKAGFLGGLLRSEPAIQPSTSKATTDINAIKSTYNIRKRVVSGKHVIVSLGNRGIMWCGPTMQLTASSAGATAGETVTGGPVGPSKYMKDGSCVINEATQSATILIPSLAVNPADIVHTNGAGDALCAGFLAEIVRKAALVDNVDETSSSGGSSSSGLPDMECIQKGLLSAHHWLVSK